MPVNLNSKEGLRWIDVKYTLFKYIVYHEIIEFTINKNSWVEIEFLLSSLNGRTRFRLLYYLASRLIPAIAPTPRHCNWYSLGTNFYTSLTCSNNSKKRMTHHPPSSLGPILPPTAKWWQCYLNCIKHVINEI